MNDYYSAHGDFHHSNAAIVATELQKGDRIDIKPPYKDMYIYGNNFSCLTIMEVK